MSIKIAMIVYHSNATAIYPASWIEQFRQSILNQTYKDFDIFEIEYGGGDYRIFENSKYESKKLPTFVDAMNYLLDKCFSAGYDYVLNNNTDDYTAITRVERQLPYMEKGIDLISSNFSLVRDDQVVHTHRFHELDIKYELEIGHNVICHPIIAMSRTFFQMNSYFPDQVPYEDLLLWKRAINKGNTFIILPEVLCFHRLHNNSVCQNENNR